MVGFLVSTAHGAYYSIDFDAMTPGTQVTTQYLSQGVFFGTNDPSGNTGVVGWGAPAISTSSPYYFYPPALSNSPTGQYPTAEYLGIIFTQPAYDVQFTFTNWGADNGTYFVAWTYGGAYLTGGALDYGPYVYPPFGLVNVGSYVGTIWIDNVLSATYGYNWEFGVATLSYSTSCAPEPCTILLLGSGLVGLAAFRKRFGI